MDIQARVCTNCMKYDAITSKCAQVEPALNISQPNTHWCWNGMWAWWDKRNNRWQVCYRHDETIDMTDRTKPPMHRAIVTTMVTDIPTGYKVTFDGRIIPEEEDEY